MASRQLRVEVKFAKPPQKGKRESFMRHTEHQLRGMLREVPVPDWNGVMEANAALFENWARRFGVRVSSVEVTSAMGA